MKVENFLIKKDFEKDGWINFIITDTETRKNRIPKRKRNIKGVDLTLPVKKTIFRLSYNKKEKRFSRTAEHEKFIKNHPEKIKAVKTFIMENY